MDRLDERPLLHVTLNEDLSDEEVNEIQSAMIEEFGDQYDLVISGREIDVAKLPRLDDYLDELADKLSERLKDEN